MKRILVIESLQSYTDILTELLEEAGYQVTRVHSAQAARKILGDMLSTGLYFNLVVLGWAEDKERQALLNHLCDDIYLNIPVLTMVDEMDESVLTWLNQRQLSGVLFRTAAPEVVTETVEKLLVHAVNQRSERAVPYPSEEQIRVLFVDDSETARNSYYNLLNANGYYCKVAEDAKHAKKLALEEFFDIAIIDYRMPEATGSDLCKLLKQDKRTNHIVNAILTSDYEESLVKECLESGAVEFMFKSESHDLFIARVDSLSRMIQIGKSIENERRRLKGILSSVADGVYGIDRDGKITFMNAAAQEILGLDEGSASLIGKDPRELFMVNPNDANLEELDESALVQAHINGTPLRNWETTFWCENQQPISVECSVCSMTIEGEREGTVVAFRDISERKLFEEELRWQANHDSLTKLLNRHYFEKQLEQEVSRRSRSRSEDESENELSAMLYLDVDRFKYINDTAGHVAGDQLLVEIGHQMQTRLRGSDTLARLGGDEFAFILRDLVEEEAFLAGNRFRKILEDFRYEYKGNYYPVAGSIGAALIDGSALPGEVLANADLACHIAKNKGGNQVHVYAPEDEDRIAMSADLGWSTKLKEALEGNHFELTFQPIVHLDVLMEANLPEEGLTESPSPWKALNQDGRRAPVLFEVLLRMRDEKGGLISPDMFLPTAERFNMMPEIDRWVIDHAFETLARERAEGRDIRFSVNLSGRTLVDKTLIGDVKKLLQKYQIPGECVTFEVTETTAITNIDVAKRLISGLKEFGCKFALDDFGSGFSSFGHLKHLDVDYVKIDGLFTQGVLTDSMDRAVVQSINDIAHSFGKYTVAEYVDNREILRVLRETGVDYAQGYFISKPKQQLGF